MNEICILDSCGIAVWLVQVSEREGDLMAKCEFCTSNAVEHPDAVRLRVALCEHHRNKLTDDVKRFELQRAADVSSSRTSPDLLNQVTPATAPFNPT